MMNLFIVVYVGAQVAGSAGPLPYGLGECHARAAEMHSELVAKLADHLDNKLPVPRDAVLLRFECEAHAERPAITYNSGS